MRPTLRPRNRPIDSHGSAKPLIHVLADKEEQRQAWREIGKTLVRTPYTLPLELCYSYVVWQRLEYLSSSYSFAHPHSTLRMYTLQKAAYDFAYTFNVDHTQCIYGPIEVCGNIVIMSFKQSLPGASTAERKFLGTIPVCPPAFLAMYQNMS